VQDGVALAYRAERTSRRNQRAIACMAKALDGFFAGLRSLAQRHATPLEKAVNHLIAQEQARGDLGAVTPLQKARITTWATQHFGPRGGTSIRHTPEREATAKICQSLTKSQLAHWKVYHRLPDGVVLDQPSPAAERERETSLQVQQALASMGVSPLVFPALARRR
jgi:hypothetical protein